MTVHTGGCLCGAIRYEVTGDPLRAYNCHCDDCRRATGSAFATNVFFKADQVKVVKGTPAIYTHIADSGNVRVKEFCSNCGTQLFSYGEARPENRSIKVGTFDDASFVKPEGHVYAPRHLPFVNIDDGLEQFEKGPQRR